MTLGWPQASQRVRQILLERGSDCRVHPPRAPRAGSSARPNWVGWDTALELGDDREILDLPVLIGPQESVVILDRHAAVRVAIRAEHERVGQQSRTAVDPAFSD